MSFSAILAADAASALPFARLRAENRAWRFAGIKLAGIILAIGPNPLRVVSSVNMPGWYSPDW